MTPTKTPEFRKVITTKTTGNHREHNHYKGFTMSLTCTFSMPAPLRTVATVLALGCASNLAIAQDSSTFRVGMTAADIPLTTGNPDQGFEGFRFMGLMLYDALVEWDLSSADEPSKLIPGLATEWSVNPDDKTKWTFKLRHGVQFHDGSEFNADAVVWNFDKVKNTEAPQYDSRQAALTAERIPSIIEVNKIDDYTVEIVTDTPTAFLPFQASYWMMSSPAQFEKVDNWEAFAQNPSGTGPWKFVSMQPRKQITLARNADYWDPDRVPVSDQVQLIPTPEASSRTSALLSGQVDWIEAPSPDAIPQLKGAGMQIITNSYPHNWAIAPSRAEGSPWNELDVRKAANLCIDRQGIDKLLGGLSIPAEGHVPPDSEWFGHPDFKLGYEPEEARSLMEKHGFSQGEPLHVKIAISTSGSGQMQPLPMFQYIQSTLNQCHFDVEAEVMEWNALLALGRQSAESEEAQAKGIDSLIISRTLMDPYSAFTRLFDSDRIPPNGSNWTMTSNPVYDDLLGQAEQEFDLEKQNATLRKFHEALVNNAEYIWVTHDVSPRALAPNLNGFVQAKSWFQDLTPVHLEE